VTPCQVAGWDSRCSGGSADRSAVIRPTSVSHNRCPLALSTTLRPAAALAAVVALVPGDTDFPVDVFVHVD
jgi:hypothetical protein